MRGDAHRLRASRDARGHDLSLSTWLVAPTSTSAAPAGLRPEVEIDGRTTRMLAEQTAAVGRSRPGQSIGHLSFDEIHHLDAALRLVLHL